MTRISKKITITKKQSDALNQIVMSRTHRLDHIERARIILFSSELKQDKDIAHELGIIPRTVRKWRERWVANEARLLLIDSAEKAINYIRKLREKQLKKWNRQWKINLIEQHNPQWLDFSIGLSC